MPVKLSWIFPGAPLTFNGAPGNIQGNTHVKLPWIFPGTPLKVNGAPGNIQGNLTGITVKIEIHTCNHHANASPLR